MMVTPPGTRGVSEQQLVLGSHTYDLVAVGALRDMDGQQQLVTFLLQQGVAVLLLLLLMLLGLEIKQRACQV
jgi:hypothetical protein